MGLGNTRADPIPPREVVERLAVRVVVYLGGRVNRHWLVVSGGRRLVLRGYPAEPFGDVGYELRVLERLDALGWPVPVAVEEPIRVAGRTWCLFKWLSGAPRVVTDVRAEQRVRGRLLAALHGDMETLVDLGQRPGCRRAEEVVADPELAKQLLAYERLFPGEARIMLWHVDRAQEWFQKLDLRAGRLIVLHSDFTNRNLLYEGGELTGVLDLEATHLNYRVADFALSWSGAHDEVIRGYEEVRRLDDLEWALLTPVYWSWLFLGVADALRQMTAGAIEPHGFEWQVGRLLRRSPLMGAEATSFPGLR